VAKTEGTATINDFSRSLALRAIQSCLAESGVAPDSRVQIILSTGSEGVISPGGYLIADVEEGHSGLPGLALGMARSRPLRPAEMITVDHARIAEQVITEAISDSGVGRDDIGLVLMKTPLLTREEAIGLPASQLERANSSGLARGVAALGIASALGEIDPSQITDDALGRRLDLYCRRAMVFSGTETRCCETIVLGNRSASRGNVRSGIVADLIDIDGMARIIAPGAGNRIEAARTVTGAGRLRAAFLKAGVAPDGRLRGNRTTVFSSDLDPDKHMRAAASGVLGALLGDTRVFVSGGAEHQAPLGGGVFAAVIAE
jgi:cyanuric acid amidohydrolase